MKKEKLCWKQISNHTIRQRCQERVSKEITTHLVDVIINNEEDMDWVIGKLNNILEISANKTIPKRKFKSCLKPYWNADFNNFTLN